MAKCGSKSCSCYEHPICFSCKKRFKWWQVPWEVPFSGDLFHGKCFLREEAEAKKLLKSKIK